MADISLTIKSNFEAAAKDLKAFGAVAESTRQRVEKFAKEFKTEQLDKFEDRQRRAAAAVKATRGEFASIQSSAKAYEREIQRLIKNGLDPESDEVKRLTKQYIKLQQEIEDTTKAEKKHEKASALNAAGMLYIAQTAVNVGRQIVNFGRDLVNSYEIQEQAEVSLRNSIEATGHQADISMSAMKDYASELQDVTLFGDEAVLTAQGLFQSLADLDQKGLQKVTPAVMDFATKMGVDLKTAMTLAGKTLGSTTNALSRYGINIDMTGTKEEKLAELTEVLESKFSGAAEAAAAASTGAFKQLSNAQGDLKEALGSVIADGLEPFARSTTTMIRRMAEWIDKSQEAKEAIKYWGEGATSQEQIATAFDVTNEKINEQRETLARLQAQNEEGQRTRGSTGGRLAERRAEIEAVEKEIAALQKQLEWLAEVEQKKKDLSNAEAERLKQIEEAGKWTAERIRQQDALAETFESIAEKEKLFGDQYDEEAAQRQAVEKALQEMLEFGFTAEGNGIARILSQYGEYIELKEDAIEATDDLANAEIAAIAATDDFFAQSVYWRSEQRRKQLEEEKEAAAESAAAWEESFNAILNASVDAFTSVMSSIDSIIQSSYDKQIALMEAEQEALIESLETEKSARLEAIDAALQAELEAAGVAEETTLERLNRELQEAFAAGDAETVKELQDEIKRTEITEKYAKERAAAEIEEENKITAAKEAAEKELAQAKYEAALTSWGFQVADATASAALAIAKVAYDPILVALASVAGAASVAATIAAKPQAPTFQTGTLPSGYTVPESRSTQGDPSYMRVNPGETVNVTPRGESGGGMQTLIVKVGEEEIYRVVNKGLKSGEISADNLIAGVA